MTGEPRVNRPRPVNQHWIPRFYLRGFATAESRQARRPKVWIFSKHHDGGEPEFVNVRNVCARRYLYSPRDGDGRRDWALEGKLGDLETSLSQIWPAASADFLDLGNNAIRKALALFIAVTWLRHPDNLAWVARAHRDLVALYEEAPHDATGNPQLIFVVNGVERVVDGTGWPAYRDATEDDHHRFFTRLIEGEATHLAEILLAKRWSVVLAREPVFITSDKPVVVAHPKKDAVGFATPGALVSFPLSPTRVLLMDDRHEEPANQYYPLHAQDPAALNYTVMRHAATFIISPRNTDEVLREIVQHADAWERLGRG